MRYVTFEKPRDRTQSWGCFRQDGTVLDVPAAAAEQRLDVPGSLLELVGAEPQVLATVAELAAGARHTSAVMPVEEIRLLAPLPRPAKNVFAVGLNYADHVAESGAETATAAELVYFSKAVTAVAPPDGKMVADPRLTSCLDWEVELGVVVGRGGRWIDQGSALDRVFGYTVVNDLSARDLQHGRPEGQWFLGKSLDGSCPMGPALVTTEEVQDPQALDITLRVNGVEKQRSNTANMIADVATIVADLSRYVTLEPGDIIATGTPAGVGGARTPQEFLGPGDVVEAEIESIGMVRTYVVAPETGDDA